MKIDADVVIVGTGVAGIFCALNLPLDRRIVMITKLDVESSDSFLAQGGICVLREESDYESYFEDTMKAGHYENRKESVDFMIRNSTAVINELVEWGVEFEKNEGTYAFTREGAHSTPRILYHKDITGREITGKLLSKAKEQTNITLLEYTTMKDILVQDGCCCGVLAEGRDCRKLVIQAGNTVLATGGIGGKYRHSTNYPHLTGDALEVAKRHGIRLENLEYVQMHPTTLYSKKPGRRFLISESVRGEGAVLYNMQGKRFVNELLPRDVVTKAIYKEMEKDQSDFVWLSMEKINKNVIFSHFPNIYRHCIEEGFDVTQEYIPVVPAQHYFMGGIWVDIDSRTSMDGLFAIGETSCNGVHGANRLASNSLLESLVFAKRSAQIMGTEMLRKQATEVATKPVLIKIKERRRRVRA